MAKKQNSQTQTKKLAQTKNPTILQRVVWVTNVIIAVVVCYYILQLICTKKYPLTILLQMNKFKDVMSAFAVFISLTLILHSCIAQWLELLSGLGDTDIYRVHRNVVNNTILWSTVFLGLYLSNRELVRKSGYELEIVDLFLLGRVVFSFGYVFGTAVGHQSIRSLGFGFTISSTVMLMSIVIGFPFIEYFK